MNVFNKVTLQSLKKNRTRTIVTIIGIMLSAALICAVTTFTSSMQKFALDSAIYMEGDWHACVSSVTTDEFEKVSSDERVSQCAYAKSLGYAKIESENKYKPYINVVAGDNTFFDTFPVHLVSGRLPKSSDEIVLSEQFYADGNSSFKKGETVTLKIGDRTADGLVLGQQNPVYTHDPDSNEEVFVQEEFVARESCTYTVVGICESPDYYEGYSNSPAYTAFTVADDKPTQGTQLDVYYKMNKPKEVYSFSEEMGLVATYNSGYNFYIESDNHKASFDSIQKALAQNGLSTQAFGDVAADSEMNRNLITIVQVFAYGFVVIISLICVANVFNTISTNIGLRRREFAMLKSVGMTRKGFNKMMNLECLLYGAKALFLGLPVSIIVTYLIYYVIAQIYGAEFYLPLKAIAIAIISVFVVVFVTMMYAMRKIKKDNPIDALKNEN